MRTEEGLRRRRERARILDAKRYRKQTEKFQQQSRLRLYGVTNDGFEFLLIAQSGACAICKDLLQPGRGTNIDHDHKTKRVRGLLCVRCNLALGHFRDSPVILAWAIKYLRRNDTERWLRQCSRKRT